MRVKFVSAEVRQRTWIYKIVDVSRTLTKTHQVASRQYCGDNQILEFSQYIERKLFLFIEQAWWLTIISGIFKNQYLKKMPDNIKLIN